jgi:hypothetical protein
LSIATAAPPILPSNFTGPVFLDFRPAVDGTLVSAWIDGARYAGVATCTNPGDPVFTTDLPAGDLDPTGVVEASVTLLVFTGSSLADHSSTESRLN